MTLPDDSPDDLNHEVLGHELNREPVADPSNAQIYERLGALGVHVMHMNSRIAEQYQAISRWQEAADRRVRDVEDHLTRHSSRIDCLEERELAHHELKVKVDAIEKRLDHPAHEVYLDTEELGWIRAFRRRLEHLSTALMGAAAVGAIGVVTGTIGKLAHLI